MSGRLSSPIAIARRRWRALRFYADLPEPVRTAMWELGRAVAQDNVVPRRSPTISDAAFVSPLASIRFAERVAIGPRTHVGPFCCIWGGWSRTWSRVGADVLLSPGVVLVAGNHGLEGPGPIRNQPFVELDAEIADGAWVGAHATVVGARVGVGAVVGAGAVVLDDVPDYAIAVGAPARIVGTRSPAPA